MSQPSAYALLLLLGAGWGLTQPLLKVAVEAGLPPASLLLWQLAIVPPLLAPLALRGATPAPGALRFAAFIAVAGVLVPNGASYVALAALPAGIVSILLSLVPIAALPIAILWGLERPTATRLAGLALGAAGILALLAPGAGAFEARALPLALIAPLCYALQANVISRHGTFGLRPEQLMALASLLALPLALLGCLATGAQILPRGALGAGHAAFLAATVVHAAVYCAYVRLLARTGPVFATQVTYVVTGAGVIWAMLLLGEQFGAPAFAGLALIVGGVALVRARAPQVGRGAA